MVVDSSALMAILRGEPEEPAFRNAIRTAPNRLLGAPTRVEASMVALGRRGEPGLEQMQALIERLDLAMVPFPDEQAKLATDATSSSPKPSRSRSPVGRNGSSSHAANSIASTLTNKC